MKNIKSFQSFLETDPTDQSPFFESNINADDLDYHGKIINVKKEIEREQKKLTLYTKIDQLNDAMRTIYDVIKDLDEMDINTKPLGDVYYSLASCVKSLS